MKKSSERVPNLERSRAPTAAEVIDRILDKGIVIEYRITRVLLCGIELPATVDSRGVIIASLDTYLRYAEPLRNTGLLADAWLGELTAPRRIPGRGGAVDGRNATALFQWRNHG
jgi:hypothetical protein